MAAKRSIIIKDPTVLERLPNCRVAIFDKTGTLTYGKPTLTEIITKEGVDANFLLQSEVKYLGDLLNLSEIHASQTPQQKLEIVRSEMKHDATLFMGDGINDAPALTAATVGIAFGQFSNVTAEAAGAVIMDNSLR